MHKCNDNLLKLKNIHRYIYDCINKKFGFLGKKILQLKLFHNLKIEIKKTPVEVVYDLVAIIGCTMYPISAQFD